VREVVIALLAAGLALAGALVQAFVARTYSRADRRRELLIEAYSDYLSGLAQRVAILEAHSPRTEAATALLITGKQKITAYAPSQVVLALAGFEQTSQRLSQGDAQQAMIVLVQAMRSSVGVESDGLESAIHAVLFGGTTFVS
jgi:hypothetical protein